MSVRLGLGMHTTSDIWPLPMAGAATLLVTTLSALGCESPSERLAPQPVEEIGVYRLVLEDLAVRGPIDVHPRLVAVESDVDDMPLGLEASDFTADLPVSLVRSLPEGVEICAVSASGICDPYSSRLIARLSQAVHRGPNQIEVGVSYTERYDDGSKVGGTIFVYSFRLEPGGGWSLLDKISTYHWDALATR
ncbi:MAG: hypothetical protein ACRELV_16035 [Longimicrobiales bacterium]